MKRSEIAFLLKRGTAASFCVVVMMLSAGCDLGTYSKRVQSNGGTLPVAAASQSAAGARSDSKAGDSNDRGADSDSRDSGRRAQREDQGKKKVTSLADIKAKSDARKAQQSEAEARARDSEQN